MLNLQATKILPFVDEPMAQSTPTSLFFQKLSSFSLFLVNKGSAFFCGFEVKLCLCNPPDFALQYTAEACMTLTMIESGRLSKPGLKRRKKLLSKPTYKKCQNNITVQVKGAKTIQNL
jgi:hypothetical protein